MPLQAPAPGQLRAVLDSVFATAPYRWREEPAPLRFLREWWNRLGDWLAALRADNPLVFRLLVLGLLLLLLLGFARAGYLVWRVAREVPPGEGRAHSGAAERRDAGWYSLAADRAAAEGRLLEALQLAFVSVALSLQEQGVLDYHAGKTPGECAREARLAAADRERLRSLVGVLYAHAFGGRPLRPDDYRRWRDAGAPPWHAAAS